MTFRRSLFASTLICSALAAHSAAQTSDAPTTATVAAVAPAADVWAFLSRVEAKNKETKTLSANFTQVRKDSTFDEEISSEGRFWYQAPSNFHAEFESRNSSQIWMDGKQYVEYIPKIKQVDIIPMEQGEDAPISQLLLGFGVQVDKIRKLFDARLVSGEPKGRVAVDFLSRDLERTMNFNRIRVTFDEKTVEPLRIELEDETSQVILSFRDIKTNPKLKDSLFVLPNWPKDVDVVTHGNL